MRMGPIGYFYIGLSLLSMSVYLPSCILAYGRIHYNNHLEYKERKTRPGRLKKLKSLKSIFIANEGIIL